MNSHQLPKIISKKKRVGRGYGSGKGGHTCGRGQKGQLSRSGHKSMVFFEGGNFPFYRRIPKYRGFKPLACKNIQVINVAILDKNYEDGDVINMESLKGKGLVNKKVAVKILGYGEISKKLIVEGLPVSRTAIEKIKKAGGDVK